MRYNPLIFVAVPWFFAMIACSNTSMSGQSAAADAKKSAVINSDNSTKESSPTTIAAADNSNTITTSDATAASGTSTVPVANQTTAAGPLVVTKTITSGDYLEDQAVTITVYAVGTNGQKGSPQTVSFGFDQQGTQSIAGICGSSPVTIGVSIKGSSGNSISTGQGGNGSTITFDPAFCILTQMVLGKTGDSIGFSCPNGQPVTVVSGN